MRLPIGQNAVGGVPGPFDAWLVLRGLKTLSVRMRQHSANAQQVACFLEQHAAVKQVHMEESLKDYIVRIVFATREPGQFGLDELRPLISFGVSPRASIFISLAARANAFLEGRDYVLPDDVKAVAVDVMRHRLIVTYQAEADEVTPEVIIAQVLDKVALP